MNALTSLPKVGLPLVLAVFLALPVRGAAGQTKAGKNRKRLYAATVRVYSMGNPSCRDKDDFACVPPIGHGSGLAFLVKEPGGAGVHVLTNHHVVEHGVAVAVEFAMADVKLPALVLHADKTVDVALLKVKAPPGFALDKLALFELSALPVEKLYSKQSYLGDPLSSPIEPGADLFIMGYGLESVQRAPEMRPGNFNRWYELPDTDELWMQVSGGVNPGNSGGPACDGEGRFIGLVVAKSIRGEDIGFIIPSGTVWRVMEEGFNRLTPIMELTTSSDEAYAGLAGTAAYFKQHLEWDSRGAEEKSKAALEQVQQQLDKALQNDPEYADCYLFLSWAMWRDFLFLGQVRSAIEERGTPQLKAALPDLHAEQVEKLTRAIELAAAAVRINPDFVGEKHPAHTYVGLMLALREYLGGAEGTSTSPPADARSHYRPPTVHKRPERAPADEGIDVSLGAQFIVTLNSQDEDLGSLDGLARLHVWHLHMVGGFKHTHNLFGHGAEDFHVDYATIGLGGRIPTWRSGSLGVEAGYLGLGSSGFSGYFVGGIVTLNRHVRVHTTHRFLTSPVELKGARPDKLGPLAVGGNSDGLYDLYLKPDAMSYQTDNTFVFSIGSDFDLEADFRYREWAPSRQIVGGGRMVSGGDEFAVVIGGLADKLDYAHPDMQDVLYKAFVCGFHAGTAGIRWPVEYRYWWSDDAPSEHAVATGIQLLF